MAKAKPQPQTQPAAPPKTPPRRGLQPCSCRRSGPRRLCRGAGRPPAAGLAGGGRAPRAGRRAATGRSCATRPASSSPVARQKARAEQAAADDDPFLAGGLREEPGQTSPRPWSSAARADATRRTSASPIWPRPSMPSRAGSTKPRRALTRAVELNPKNRVHAFHDPDFAELRQDRDHRPPLRPLLTGAPRGQAAARRSSRSAAAPGCPPCCAASSTTSARSGCASSPAWSPSPTTAAPPAGCARSSASCRRATSATASRPWPTTRTSSPGSSSTASPTAAACWGTPSATCS